MAQPHRPPTPPGSDPAYSTTGATAGLASSVTATSPQIAFGGPDGDHRGGLDGRRWLTLAVCAVLGMVIGVVGYQVTTDGGDTSAQAQPAPSPTATARVAATVTPVAPTGSSFSQNGGAWRSQTYSDANFGSLKDGIGLLLDLGSERPLTSVTFTAQTGPITVELRAGDSPSKDGNAYELVGSPVQATGPTTLPATTGGSKRYWMIWVTQLPPDTFQARIADPVARG